MPFIHPINGQKFINVDLFAGGGMVSEAFRNCYGVDPDIAINHDEDAIGMHKANHPGTKHYRESVFKTDPAEAVRGLPPIWHLHASPDCTHFSVARGVKPVKKHIRSLADVVHLWIERTGEKRPHLITVENVKEFTGAGPTIEARIDERGKRVPTSLLLPLRTGEDMAEGETRYYQAGKVWCDDYGVAFQVPDPRFKGKDFQKWDRKIRRYGYRSFWGVMCFAEHGDATSRTRMFYAAQRLDTFAPPIGKRTHWPAKTHGDPKSKEVQEGKLKPWRTAADIIDWSRPCPSILMTREEAQDWNKETGQSCKRPIAFNSRARVAMGLKRYVFDSAEPFVVKYNHAGHIFRGQGSDDPLQTLTASREYCVASPYFTKYYGTAQGASPQEPVHTLTAKDRLSVATPYLTRYYGKGHGSAGAEDPIHTLTARDRLTVVSPFLSVHAHSSSPRSHAADAPLPTQVAGVKGGHFAPTAVFLARHNKGMTARDVREPLPTLTAAGSQVQAVSAKLSAHHLIKLMGSCKDGQPIDQPVPTLRAGGNHVGTVEHKLAEAEGTAGNQNRVQQVRDFLQEFFGPGGVYEGQLTDEQMLGVVTIGGTKYQIIDIGMRMLTPREGFRAHTAREDMVIDRRADGKPITVSKQMEKVGNSVPIEGTTAFYEALNEKHNWDTWRNEREMEAAA